MIVFLTDTHDYSNVMKAAIRSLNENVEFMDLSNNISSYNIIEGAWLLLNNYFYFPRQSIFLCIVDPGVGTKRPGVIVQTKNYVFIGPDNGLMYSAAKDDGILRVFKIDSKKMETLAKSVFLRKYQLSKTFEGRDIFSIVAASLENEFNINFVGEFTKLKEKLDVSPKFNKGIIVSIDHYGNIITNIKRGKLINKAKILLNHGTKKEKIIDVKIHNAYDDAKPKELFLIQSSANTMEIAMKQSSANEKLKLKVGTKLCLK